MNKPDHRSQAARQSFFARWTTCAELLRALVDAPEAGWRAWLRTTAGLVALLLALQLCTGLLLACYYVPATDNAHATVAFIEKGASGGAWLRALHVYGSVLLPCALVLHLAQRLRHGRARQRPVGWLASVALLALALAAGGTGYTLPGDANAYYSTRVAEGLLRGLPLIGETARLWLLGGPIISTLTLSRLFALHALLLPLLILTTVVARLFIFREQHTTLKQISASASDLNDAAFNEQAAHTRAWFRVQLARNTVVAGLIFTALALYAAKYPAPFGPRADAAPAGYLPRPGAQFLWLYELLKHTSGTTAALAGLLLPGLLLALFALLPWLGANAQTASRLRRHAGALLIGLTCALILSLTALALVADTRDARVRAQLTQQAAAEASFRRAPFIPQRPRTTDTANGASAQSVNQLTAHAPTDNTNAAPPAAYAQQCAKCHGAHGEGVRPNPKLLGVAAQPHRTIADLIAILNDPAAYGLEKPMNSFANKLTADEKRQLAEWIEELK